MFLKSVNVRAYKCFLDSGNVPIEQEVTCLVGKNESGKTAFLESLYHLNPAQPGPKTFFNELYDYPRRFRSEHKGIISDIRPVETVFELEAEDIQVIEEKFGKGVLKSNEITLSVNYENVKFLGFEVDEKAFLKHLSDTGELSETRIQGLASLETLKDQLLEVDDPPPPIKKMIENLADFNLSERVKSQVAARLPYFVYFNEYSVLPGRFSIPYLQQAKEDELSLGERTALNLLRLAGVDTVEFLEGEYEARKAALEVAAASITDEIFEYWSQNKNLRVEFDVDFKSPSQDDRPPPFLDIRIWNNHQRVSLRFDERSKGFIWFFSFLVHFSEFHNSNERFILLLDEPGLGLHATAQADLLRFIGERLAPSHQLIYTTNSPFMIKVDEVQRVRAVEDRGEEGTIVTKDIYTVSRDTALPVHGALGYHLARSLFVGPNNLIVNNPSDILYLKIISAHLQEKGRTGLDSRLAVVPASGISEIPIMLALLGSDISHPVLLDVLAVGDERIEMFIKSGVLDRGKLFPIAEITGGESADVEDLFDPSFFLMLLRGSMVADVDLAALPPGDQIVKRVEQHLKQSVDVYQPAMFFLQNQTQLLSKMTNGTLDRFEQLFTLINNSIR